MNQFKQDNELKISNLNSEINQLRQDNKSQSGMCV